MGSRSTPWAAGTIVLALTGASLEAGVQTSYDLLVGGFESKWEGDSALGTGSAAIEYDRFGNQQIILNGTGWNATARAEVDLATGTLKTRAHAISVSDRNSDPRPWGSCDISAKIAINDKLYFAEDTWVTLRGHLDGYYSARTSSTDGGWSQAGVDLQILILNFNASGEQEIQALRFVTKPSVTETYGGGAMPMLPTPDVPDVDLPFEVQALIPAGEMHLKVDMMSWANSEVYLESWLDYASSQSNADFSNTASFELLIPQGAVVTSESGLVPISVVPEPASMGVLLLHAVVLMRRWR